MTFDARPLATSVTLPAFALALVLAGCGGGSDDDSTAASTAAATAAEAPAAAEDAASLDAELAGTRPQAGAAPEADASREQAATVTTGVRATTPGAVSVPFPTLRNLSVEWAISGDADLDGVVSVRFRPQGSTTWRTGMALRRVPDASNAGFAWTNRHSGSILDLQPNTTYEIELTLTDPDGGSAVRTVTARTRAVPAPMANAPVKNVTPSTFASVAAAAQPGDILQLGAGTYSGFSFGRSGAAGKPIVVRSSAGAVVNGNIDLFYQSHVIFSGLTINGRVRLNGTKHVALMRNTIRTSGDGIVHFLRSENSYIADNTITGATRWASSSLGVNGNNIGEGILVTGPGHVIEHNRVSGFRDNISFLEQGEAVDQYSIDVIGNDLRVAADDAVEADYCFHNCRILRNRVTNAFVGLSAQPTLGGPAYFVRNAMYNVVYTPFKLHNGSNGNVILHNTVVKNGDALGIYAGAPIARLLSRNNLFIGGPGGTWGGYSNGSGRATAISDLVTSNSSLDYDAFGSTSGAFSGWLGGTSYSSLDAMRSATSEKNARSAGLSTFAAAVAYPSAPMTELAPADLRPKTGSPVENAAVRIPNVNDSYVGTAPDRGAYEVGSALPVYGPR